MDYDRKSQKSQKSHVKMQMEKMVNMDKMDSANFTKEEKMTERGGTYDRPWRVRGRYGNGLGLVRFTYGNCTRMDR